MDAPLGHRSLLGLTLVQLAMHLAVLAPNLRVGDIRRMKVPFQPEIDQPETDPAPAPRRKHRRRDMKALVTASTLALALASACVLGACTDPGDGTGVTIVDAGDGTEGGLHGVVPTEPFPKPALDLTDTDGAAFDLRERTQGKITLLFFGYTNCPDVCPTTMADLASALNEVGPEVSDQVSVVFVSTDPERDTGEVLDRWLNQFDETFIGVRGPFERVREEAEALGVTLEEPEMQADGSVLVTHGAEVIAFGRDGRARLIYPAGTRVPDYIADLPILTTEAGIG